MAEEPRRFKILGSVSNIQEIARGRGVGIEEFLQDTYGGRHWRKMKGDARVEKDDGWIGNAEVHWFEAHGVGKVRWKIKRKLQP